MFHDLGSFLNAVHAHLPTVVVAIAVVLAPALQLLKKYVPQVTGWKAVAANFAIAIVAVFSVTPAGQFWTVDAWMRVVELSGLAAGIHGTAKRLLAPSGDPAQAAVAKKAPPV
jgi:hypothetical protein